MRISNALLLLVLCLSWIAARAENPPAADKPAPAPAQTAPPEAKKPAAPKSAESSSPEPSDEVEPPPKKAPKRFVPTEKGKADEDIPFPVDI